MSSSTGNAGIMAAKSELAELLAQTPDGDDEWDEWCLSMKDLISREAGTVLDSPEFGPWINKYREAIIGAADRRYGTLP